MFWQTSDTEQESIDSSREGRRGGELPTWSPPNNSHMGSRPTSWAMPCRGLRKDRPKRGDCMGVCMCVCVFPATTLSGGCPLSLTMTSARRRRRRRIRHLVITTCRNHFQRLSAASERGTCLKLSVDRPDGLSSNTLSCSKRDKRVHPVEFMSVSSSCILYRTEQAQAGKSKNKSKRSGQQEEALQVCDRAKVVPWSPPPPKPGTTTVVSMFRLWRGRFQKKKHKKKKTTDHNVLD